MRTLLGLIFLLIALSSANAQEVPNLVELGGYVCTNQADAELIGEAWQKGGDELAKPVAVKNAEEGKCGVLKEKVWAIAQPLKVYHYQGVVVRLYAFHVSDQLTVYGLQRTDELVT